MAQGEQGRELSKTTQRNKNTSFLNDLFEPTVTDGKPSVVGRPLAGRIDRYFYRPRRDRVDVNLLPTAIELPVLALLIGAQLRQNVMLWEAVI